MDLKKKAAFVKPVMKKQPTVDHITGDKIPKGFVFSRGKLPGSLRQLQMDLRKLMLPYTALKLKVINYYHFVASVSYIGVFVNLVSIHSKQEWLKELSMILWRTVMPRH